MGPVSSKVMLGERMKNGHGKELRLGATTSIWKRLCVQRTLFVLFGILLVALAFLFAVIAVNLARRSNLDHIQHPETGYEFPSHEEIAWIRARSDTVEVDFPEFELPANHWATVLAGLSPSQYDREPAAWQVLVSLDIHTIYEETIRVDVYDLEDGPIGAFAVDSPAPHGRRYYRGGNTHSFLAAITAARKDLRE
jgi:hypothetical protein